LGTSGKNSGIGESRTLSSDTVSAEMVLAVRIRGAPVEYFNLAR
jgi:hypothetical protein